MKITAYNGLCNLGIGIKDIYPKALSGDISCFTPLDYIIENRTLRTGMIDFEFSDINDKNYNLRCNKFIIKTLNLLNNEINDLLNKYKRERIGIVAATTNSGVEEYEKTLNPKHFELGNPALFTQNFLSLKGYCATVSTACSSGIKAFSLAKDLLDSNVMDSVIVVCVDSMAKVPLFGFSSLEVLSDNPSLPFSKNRAGMNIGEACAIFITEKDAGSGIEIMGIGESSDIYHPTTPDPNGIESIIAIKQALENAKITPEKVDYINAHGTGTIANDLMEANAIYEVFGNKVPVSSTKPLTGHCLGAAAGIEILLCCELLDNFSGKFYPNIYDNQFDNNLPNIKLVGQNDIYDKCNICMCNSFGFGGANAIMILGKNYVR